MNPFLGPSPVLNWDHVPCFTLVLDLGQQEDLVYTADHLRVRVAPSGRLYGVDVAFRPDDGICRAELTQPLPTPTGEWTTPTS
ncbi:hypothetical protein NHX12_007170 [Muraenolepis orangiensis]|uniref:Uncharacterized protein n=1 Tax=Muraenolepis orangiensis TaxID=630683 RepID=A0A9Q0DRT5_9TELE|nr:hypothetical protein NHX12_007170 [Muraenolepis orangiensis]